MALLGNQGSQLGGCAVLTMPHQAGTAELLEQPHIVAAPGRERPWFAPGEAAYGVGAEADRVGAHELQALDDRRCQVRRRAVGVAEADRLFRGLDRAYVERAADRVAQDRDLLGEGERLRPGQDRKSVV